MSEREGTNEGFPTNEELHPENPEDNLNKPDKETQEHIDKMMKESGVKPDIYLYQRHAMDIFCALIQAEDWRRGSQKDIDENIQWYIKLAYTMAERFENHQP